MVSRRTFITATGSTLAAVGLAGCSSSSNSESDDTTQGDGETSGTGAGNASQSGNGTQSNNDTAGPVDQKFDPVNLAGEDPESLGEGVALISHTAFETEEDVGVTGVIENTGEAAFSQVEVTVELQDDDIKIEESVDTSSQELDRLQPGLQWRFWTTFETENLTDSMSYVLDVSAERVESATATGEPGGNETVAVDGSENDTAQNSSETTN